MKIKKSWRKTVILSLLISIVLFIAWQYYQTQFTIERWKSSNPQQRGYMLNDLFQKHNLIGLSKNEVLDLLGEGYAQDNDNKYSWCYHVGDRFSFTMDLLYIEFENDIVIDYYVHTMNV